MKTCLLVILFLVTLAYAWPPVPPPVPPQVGKDIPGGDLAGMPITLSSDNYTLCAAKCQETPQCNAWAYGLESCEGKPLCWLKATAGQVVENKCRVYGITPKSACQLPTQWTHLVDPKQPLPYYPRPQMKRAVDLAQNLNGLWEFTPGTKGEAPPFGVKLEKTILVPFPVESCLSGIGETYQYLWYRKVMDKPNHFSSGRILLHFGAVDWQTTVYINKKKIGMHTGGYSGFSFDVTSELQEKDNEIIVGVFDPTENGGQPFGKQQISKFRNPGGDHYSPASGIWQTVWMENVPSAYIQKLKISTDMKSVSINVTSTTLGEKVTFKVLDNGKEVANATGKTGDSVRINVPNPKLWGPRQPNLYDLEIALESGDSVTSYFGMRTVSKGKDSKGVTRPLINGNFTFLAGWLDQSFWPDGIYTAPTYEALAYDLKALDMFGMNFVRLHQKVNPEVWYHIADTLGIVVQQDMIQHFDIGTTPDPDLYHDDLKAMIDDRYNHPCIVQWTAFNEEDMVKHFDAKSVVEWISAYDPSRLTDTDSGGPANNLHVGDVNDIHTYPDPKIPLPSDTQYAEIGEFGGLGAFVAGHVWLPNRCYAYRKVGTPSAQATAYVAMAKTIQDNKKDVSISVYTQITDVELECDGFLNYDRTNKFSEADTKKIRDANLALINA